MAEAETIKYRGNCHCGDFVFEAKVPEIKAAFHCECSICIKKGYLWLMPGTGNVNIVKGSLEDLTVYTFGEKKLKHLFCPKCATAVGASWWKDEQEDPQHALKASYINAHTIQGLNCWDLKRIPYDGVSRGEPFQPPVHKGELPKAEEGEVVYTGSCHCGALTIAAPSKPLDETFQGGLECNCSICERIAAIWIFPLTKSVFLSGDEANIGRYEFNRRSLYKRFCKICGVGMTNNFKILSEEEIAALPEMVRTVYEKRYMHTSVNARVLHGVDVTKLETRKVDGLNGIPGDYVNP
ncbi:hypothetical protein ACHAQJ_004286 [Trichoderma viride]